MELGLAVPQVLPKHVQTLQTLQSGEEVHLLHGTTATADTCLTEYVCVCPSHGSLPSCP